MCGLFGIFPKAGADHLSLRILALFLGLGNVSRGRHSFGLWGNGVEPFRALGALNDDENIIAFRKFIFEAWNPEEGKWLAGHTRQATHGAKTLENTHPFSVGTLTLAHNGVVSVEGYSEKEHSVDSGRIALSIVEHGWKPGLANVSGSCALIASVDERLVLYRHNQVLHMVEEPWGWAISSEKHTLSESIKLAGLSMAGKPEEIIADHVIGPWENVSTHCPAKAYVAPTYPARDTKPYYGGYWEEGSWVPFSSQRESIEYYNNGRRHNGSMGFGKGTGTQQPLPLNTSAAADETAKRRFLGGANSADESTPEAIKRAAEDLIRMKAKDSKGRNIELGVGSKIKDQVIEWAIEVKRFENMLTFVCDPDTKETTRMITPLGISESWYKVQSEEIKDNAWATMYAHVLVRIGCTTEEYNLALDLQDVATAIRDKDLVTCDWCGDLKYASEITSRNFGMDPIGVCSGCTKDFEDARRGLDFRDNKVDNGRRKRSPHVRKGN